LLIFFAQGTEKSNGGAEDAAGLVQEAATHALQMPDHADQLSHNDDQMQLRWPRRLGSAFRVSVACAKRLQGVLRRYDARTRHREASSATRNLLQYCVRRAVVERKYRFALRRDALQLHVPTVVRGSLFLREEEMDRVDRARYAQLLSKRLELEVLYQKMRSNQNVLAKTEKDYKEIVEYEDKLYKDLTRGGGGGLVRKLGGQKAATKALEDAQASLALLTSLRLSQKVGDSPAVGAVLPSSLRLLESAASGLSSGGGIPWSFIPDVAPSDFVGAFVRMLTPHEGKVEVKGMDANLRRKLCRGSKRTSSGCLRAASTRSFPAKNSYRCGVFPRQGSNCQSMLAAGIDV
jgi:hypothetical protein